MNERDGIHPLASVPGVLALAVWAVYLLLALMSIPEVPYRMLIAGFFGVLACLAVVLNYRRWRFIVLLASSVYLLVYAIQVTRMTMMVTDPGKSPLSALSFYYSTLSRVSATIFQEKGVVGGLTHGFLEYVMPFLSAVLIGAVLISRRPKPGVSQIIT